MELVLASHEAGSRVPRHAHAAPFFCINHGGSYVEDFGRRRRTCDMFVPSGRSINPITQTNWEGVGVVPGIPTPASDALDKALDLGRAALNGSAR